MRVGALSIFVASSADVTLYKISGTGCGEATLDAKYESAAISFAGLKEGTCASQGYTVDDGTTTENVPVLGSIVIHKYTKPATMEAVATPVCPPPQYGTVDNFDLKAYVSATWYMQQQMPIQYLPTSLNYCVQAHYTLKKSRTLLGYDIDVHNYAQDKSGAAHSVSICARVVDQSRGQLEVAPCYIPAFLGGPYFVVAYNETEGYALISGGPPQEPTADGCKTGDGVSNSGLWIATRKQQRDEQLVEKVRNIAVSKGFDISVLNDIDHTNCKSPDNAVVV